jgi:integrase
MAKPMTAVSLLKLKPGRYKDRQQGLVVLVHPTGRRVFQFRARADNGRVRKLVLGAFSPDAKLADDPVVGQPLTLSGARHLAAKLWRDRELGVDPFAAARAVPKVERAFGDVAREFIEKHAKRSTRRWRETAQILGVDPDDTAKVLPKSLADVWRDKPLASIDGDLIHQQIEKATEDGVPGRGVKRKGYSAARGRALGRTLSAMFGWALKRRYIRTNPVAGVDIPKMGSRDRVLTAEEIATVWKAFDAAGDMPARVLRLLLLTGQRLNEIRCMQWSEIAVERGEWTLRLPRERTKNKLPHDVPLSSSAVALLESTPRIDGGEFVFSLDGVTPITVGTKAKQAIDKAAKIPRWNIHDLRRTAITQMAEYLGIAPHVIEAVVNHVSGHKAGVAGVYNRATYANEKRAALERWAQRVDQIVKGEEPSNVVPMTGRPA